MYEQLKKAIDVYNKHTVNSVLDYVSNKTLMDISTESWDAKRNLRIMLRNHPNWDEETQTVILKAQTDAKPDKSYIRSQVIELCSSNIYRRLQLEFSWFFPVSDITDWLLDEENLLPDNVLSYMDYHEGQKKNRALRKLFVKMGCWDEHDHDQQAAYAKLSDGLRKGVRDVNLILSINPAHFLTMSNPKECTDGNMLTSCHSLNSLEYEYNNGCMGYALDDITMIAFTVHNINDADSWFYRKTSRQLFMYKPKSSILLQSRMYNTEGGLDGTDSNTKIYRELVQDCISSCEESINLWDTKPYVGNSLCIRFYENDGFGGYPDWDYSEFCAKVSVRKDWKGYEDGSYAPRTFKVGSPGKCLHCGCSLSSYIYCPDCNEEFNMEDSEND